MYVQVYIGLVVSVYGSVQLYCSTYNYYRSGNVAGCAFCHLDDGVIAVSV